MLSFLRTRQQRKQVFFGFTAFLVFYLILTNTTLTVPHGSISTPHLPPPNPSSKHPSNPKILLVSAFFPLSSSKHSHSDYEIWLSKFLGPITTPIYFYIPPSLVDLVKRARGPGKEYPIYLNTSYTSPFDIPPLKGLEDAYKHQHSLDRENFRHNPELYAVWNAKPWLLDNAVQHLSQLHSSPSNTSDQNQLGNTFDYVFWNDAGSFRNDHDYKEWPYPERVQEIFEQGEKKSGIAREELFFIPFTGFYSWLNRYWKEGDGPVDSDISEGSFFGGSPATVSWWSKTYYAYHNHYLKLGLFIGKDQTLINAIFLLYPSRIFGIWLDDPTNSNSDPSSSSSSLLPLKRFNQTPLGQCGSSWFYYQFWLSSNQDRNKMQERWLKDMDSRKNDVKPWFVDWDWWRESQRCRVGPVFLLKDELWNRWGNGWSVDRSSSLDVLKV